MSAMMIARTTSAPAAAKYRCWTADRGIVFVPSRAMSDLSEPQAFDAVEVKFDVMRDAGHPDKTTAKSLRTNEMNMVRPRRSTRISSGSTSRLRAAPYSTSTSMHDDSIADSLVTLDTLDDSIYTCDESAPSIPSDSSSTPLRAASANFPQPPSDSPLILIEGSHIQNTTCPYAIPPELLDSTASCEPPSAPYWSHLLYRAPHPHPPKVTVHYCRSLASSEGIAQLILSELMLDPSSPHRPVLGFDIEWSPSASATSGPRRNVSLVQLATPSRIALFHLSLFAGPTIPSYELLVPPTLAHILSHPSIAKVGVAITADCTRIRTHLGIVCRGIFELSHLYRVVKYFPTGDLKRINKQLVSLQRQVEDVLPGGLRMFKDKNVRASDWTKALKKEQVDYAASDGYAGLMLWYELERRRLALSPMPDRPYDAELGLPIPLGAGVAPVPQSGVEGEAAHAHLRYS